MEKKGIVVLVTTAIDVARGLGELAQRTTETFFQCMERKEKSRQIRKEERIKTWIGVITAAVTIYSVVEGIRKKT